MTDLTTIFPEQELREACSRCAAAEEAHVITYELSKEALIEHLKDTYGSRVSSVLIPMIGPYSGDPNFAAVYFTICNHVFFMLGDGRMRYAIDQQGFSVDNADEFLRVIHECAEYIRNRAAQLGINQPTVMSA